MSLLRLNVQLLKSSYFLIDIYILFLSFNTFDMHGDKCDENDEHMDEGSLEVVHDFASKDEELSEQLRMISIEYLHVDAPEVLATMGAPNGPDTNALLDTGAELNLIEEHWYHHYLEESFPRDPNRKAKLRVTDQSNAPLHIDPHFLVLDLVVQGVPVQKVPLFVQLTSDIKDKPPQYSSGRPYVLLGSQLIERALEQFIAMYGEEWLINGSQPPPGYHPCLYYQLLSRYNRPLIPVAEHKQPI